MPGGGRIMDEGGGDDQSFLALASKKISEGKGDLQKETG